MFKSLLTLLAVVLLVSCSANPSKQIDEGSEWEEVSDPMRPLSIMASEIIESGGVAAYGEGRSTRRDLAREKGRSNALGALAEVFNQKVDRMRKTFQEEVGQGEESEVNELFSVVTKSTTSQALSGAFEKDYKVLQNKQGEYMYVVVMAITTKSANMSILDEMQAKKPELYQRFRASEAFKELQNEIDKQ